MFFSLTMSFVISSSLFFTKTNMVNSMKYIDIPMIPFRNSRSIHAEFPFHAESPISSDSCVFFLLSSSTPLLKIATAFPRQANYLVLAIHFGATCFEPMPFGLSVGRIESPPSNDQTELNTTQVPNFSGEKNIYI